MKRSTMLKGGFAVAFLAMTVAAAAAHDNKVSTHLIGYHETPLTINSTGSGDFEAKISDDGTSITYTETYQDLSSAVLQSHIHFGEPAISGGIVLFVNTGVKVHQHSGAKIHQLASIRK
jgi:hypothetical protein